jgi:NAD(P)-dependent dehydrogenase (short-subunit alcohol dehydrogenase family)
MGRLDGKVAIITGGASGMGRASALLFAREAAAVVVADIDEEGGRSVVREVQAAGGRAVFQRTDVADEADVAAVVERAVSEYGRLNVMFNNAGIGGPMGVEGTSVDELDHAWRVILRGVFLGMKHAIPRLREAGGGAIVSTSSDAGLRPLPGATIYSALKAGVNALTLAVAQDVGKDGIRVNAIAPGWIETPLLRGAMGLPDDAARRVMTVAQPIKRPGSADDIAKAALFLASDEAAFVSGVVLNVDGGWLSMGLQHPEANAELARAAAEAGAPDWFES